jgi:DNA-binding Lrp family transcriptional regulator
MGRYSQLVAVAPHSTGEIAEQAAAFRPTSALPPNEQRIVEVLQEDARMSYAELARRCSITEKTARRKVAELLEAQIVEFTVVTDPAALGYKSMALIGIQVTGEANVAWLLERFSALHNVDYVVAATGRYPIYVEALAADSQAMLRFVNDEIYSVPGVLTAEIFPYLRLHYQEAQFSLARSAKSGTSGVRPSELDTLGHRLVQLLGSDGRMSFRTLAQQLNVPESTVRQHVKRLTFEGAFRPLCLVNPLRLGFQAVAWLALTAAPNTSLTDLADMLAETSRISYVAITAGRFDIFAEVVCADNAELLDFLETHIRASPLVATVETAIYLHLNYKPLSFSEP